MDGIKIQELVGSLQTYELGLPSHKSSKSLALKTRNERINDSSDEDDVEKEVAYLAKGSSHPPKVTKETSRRRMGKTHHHLKGLYVSNAMAMSI